MYAEKPCILWVYNLSMIFDVALFIVFGILYPTHVLAVSCIALHWTILFSDVGAWLFELSCNGRHCR